MEGDGFRRESSRLVSLLVRSLGPQHLQLAEDAVQTAFVRALEVWPLRGEPPNRTAWLAKVAYRAAIDLLRRDGVYVPREELPASPSVTGVFDDAELEMLFLCCHPSIGPNDQIALILRELCGLGTREIAASLLLSESALYQRLVRAKRTLKSVDLGDLSADCSSRLDSVLHALYLLFNEGYAAHGGGELVSFEICDEAIMLVDRLAKTSVGDQPAAHALCGLMLLQSSRLSTRVDSNGLLCLLEYQDRSLWDRSRISAGVRRLELASRGSALSRYHLEAVIALEHALAPSYAATNWSSVVTAYDDLIRVAPGPVVALNRGIAVAMLRGPEAGLREIESLQMEGNHLLFSSRAALMVKKGCVDEAVRDYRKALELATTTVERRWLQGRLDSLAGCSGDRGLPKLHGRSP